MIENKLPIDFNWKEYLELNIDLQIGGIITKENLEKHWLQHGCREKRRYSKNLPIDFNWKKYLELNIDLKIAGIITKEDLEYHWIQHGCKENRKYSTINLNWEKYLESCYKLIPFLPNHFPKIDKFSNKKSLLVECRELKHNEFIIKNTIQKLGDGWGHIIYCSNINYKQIKSICDSISVDIEIRILNTNNLTINEYNNILLDINFWNEINCEKVLVYQTDTFIFKNFDNKFLKYDWIGASWGPGKHLDMLQKKLKISSNMIHGNGGLSLRTVELIKIALLDKDFSKKHLYNNINISFDKIQEDVYFSLYACDYGNYPKETADFSIEPTSIFYNKICENTDPFGYHKIYDFRNYTEIFLYDVFFKYNDKKNNKI